MVVLREFDQSDAPKLVELANNLNVARYLVDTFPHPYTDEDAKWWVSTGSKSGITKVIQYNGEFVGSVGAMPDINERRFSASIGYWVGQPFWGKGIASQALSILTNEVFATTDIIRISASVYHPNRASMRVLEKSGYVREAVLKAAVFKNDEFYDEHVFVKFKH